MIEVWKDIPNYEGVYQVSDLGRVKSIKSGKDKILKPILLNGYYAVGLCKRGYQVKTRIHQLVAIAFLSHIPQGMKLVVDHINNNPLDNRVKNLQLITQKENLSKDRIKKYSFNCSCYLFKPLKKWIVKVQVNGKIKILKVFTNEFEAYRFYKNELKKIAL
jgi:hypothetical protein